MWTYRVLDCTFSITNAGPPEAAGELQRVFGRHRIDEPSETAPIWSYRIIATADGSLRLFLDGSPVASAGDHVSLVGMLAWSVNQEIARRSTSHVLVHGGAVSRGDVAIVLPGTSGAGKSTLTAALMLEAWSYCSDEIIAFHERTGLVHSYGLPLSVKRGSWSLFPSIVSGRRDPDRPTSHLLIEPEAFGASVSPPTRLGAIVLPRYDPDGDGRLTPRSAGTGLTDLLDHCLNPKAIDQRRLETLAGAVKDAASFSLAYSDVSDAARTVTERFESRAALA